MTVSFSAVGTWQDGVTGLVADEVMLIPAAQVTGDLMVILASWKDFGITATVTGGTGAWTEITEFADGAVAAGNGTGSMKVGAWYRVATTDTEADPTLDFSTTVNLVGEAVVIVFSKTLADWVTPTFVTAAWPSQASGTVSASSSLDVPTGGAVILLIGLRDDSAAFPRGSGDISSVGNVVTWNGNYAEQPATHASTTTGNDMACDAGYRLVTTGVAGVTLNGTINPSLAAAETGAMLWIVINDVAAAAERVPYYQPMKQLLPQ